MEEHSPTIGYRVQKQEILKALTETPATFIAQGENIGTLEKNKVASFTVYNSDPFENKKAKANEIWLKGERKQLSVFQEIEISGSYHLNRSDARFILEFSGPSNRKSVSLFDLDDKGDKIDSTKSKVIFKQDGNDVTLTLKRKDSTRKYAEVMHGKATSNGAVIEGDVVLKNGLWEKWSAIRFKTNEASKKQLLSNEGITGKCWYPNMSYGFDSLAQTQSILFSNVTVWTNENEGILKELMFLSKTEKLRKSENH